MSDVRFNWCYFSKLFLRKKSGEKGSMKNDTIQQLEVDSEVDVGELGDAAKFAN